MMAIQGVGVLFGGYQATQQQKSICANTKDVKAQVEQYTRDVQKQIDALKSVDAEYIKQILANSDAIQSNMYALQQSLQAQSTSYQIMQVIMITMVVIVALMFVLKRRGLLGMKLEALYASWTKKKTSSSSPPS